MINDEMLNRYIDGELNNSEENLLKAELKNSFELQKRLSSLKAVHSTLKNIPLQKTSENFTNNLMTKISKPLKAKRDDKYFIWSLITVFIIFFSSVFSYFTASAFEGETTYQSLEVFSRLSEILSPIKDIFSSKNTTVIGSIFSLAVFVTGYFFFENIRTLRKF